MLRRSMMMIASPLVAMSHVAVASAFGGAFVRSFPDDSEWTQVVIRGEAAQFLFDSFTNVREEIFTRDDGTTFRVRLSASFGCAISEIRATPMYACVSFVKYSGETANGVLDPEMGGVARIGVSN